MGVGGGANRPYGQSDYGDPDNSAGDRHPPEDFGNALSRAPCGIERGLRTGAARERQRAYQEDMWSRAISATGVDASGKKVDDG